MPVGRDEAKILLGILGGKNSRYKAILDEFSIHLSSICTLTRYNVPFYNIRSPNIQRHWLACFGLYGSIFPDDFNEDGELLEASIYFNSQDEVDWVAAMLETRNHLLEDAAYWIKVISRILEENNEVWLLHYRRKNRHEKMQLVEIYCDELTPEHLLKLEENDTIVIRKRE